MKKLLILLLLLPLPGFGQQYSLLQDSAALEQVKEITNSIYNNQHQEVKEKLQQLSQEVPASHPVFPLLNALNLYWKEAPMHSGSPSFTAFISYLQETVNSSNQYLNRKQDEILVNFLALSAHGLLTRFHADEGDYMAAVGEAKEAYALMKKGFDLSEQYSEFYFPVGLYNYYREKYPELHPVYKPFSFFFRGGDIRKGLEQLQYAARHNVFSKPEAGAFLVHIYLYYENNPAAALKNIQQLQEEYPNNRFFKAQLAEVYLANGMYSKAVPHINFLLKQNDPYYKMAGYLFKGIYMEKKEREPEQAKRSYDNALQTGVNIGPIANVYNSMAYAGLARYHHQKNETKKAKEAYKKALALASYEYPVKKEAEEYLK